MTATPRQTLGHALAAKLRKPRRRVRPKRPASRSTQRNAEARKLLKTIRVRNAEQAIESSPLGRHLLELSDARTAAGFKEDFAHLALHAAREDAARARVEHSRVCSQLRYGEYDKAHRRLWEAEALVRKASQLHRQAVHTRELADVELRLLARAAR
ncbi:MAG: hypothetical protein IH884_02435 [Myxococcales bacterium]|nr:hypothetical protein [Myxococcales bacterium]